MKKLVTLLAFFTTMSLCYAQDHQILGESDIIGTARFVGMGGAMTAIGGDPSSVVLNNPAGLGVYRSLEAMISFGLDIDRSKQMVANGQVGTRDGVIQNIYFIPTQTSAVFAFGRDGNEGILFNNLMISYQRMRNWNRTYAASLQQEPTQSIANIMAANANQYNLPSAPTLPDMDNAAWLTYLGFKDSIIDLFQESDGSYIYDICIPTDYKIGQAAIISDKGFVQQFNINYAMNVSNRFYWGLGLGIQSLSRTHTIEYAESYATSPSTTTSMSLYSYTRQTGIGVNGSIGFIYRPAQFLRLGASFITPTAMSLKTTTYGDSQAFDYQRVSTSTYRQTDNAFTQPMRVSASAAIQMLDRGLLSFQYDYQHHRLAKDLHSLRVGLEIVPAESFYLNAGYAFTSHFLPLAEQPLYTFSGLSVRTDTDWSNLQSRHQASIGFGYRGAYMIAQIAYQCSIERLNVYAHELADPYDMQAFTHRVTLSLAFHSK